MSVIAEEYVAYRYDPAPYIGEDPDLSNLGLYIRIQGNQFRYEASFDTLPGENDAAITGGTAQVTIDSTLQTQNSIPATSYGPNGGTAANITGDLTTATSTVRLVVVVTRRSWYGGSAYSPVTTYTYDQTFTVKQPTSLTQPLLTAATVTRPWIVFLPSTNTLNYLHLKNTGNQEMHVRVKTRSIDGSTNSRRLPANAGMTLFQDGASSWFIGSYFGGTVTTGTATGGTTPTSPIVLANITSGSKTVALPNPATFASSYLCICAYTTGTSTTNSLVIVTNGYARETSSNSYSWTTAAGPAIGLFLVSDGTKWNIIGIHRGGTTVYDADATTYTGLTSTLGLANASPTNGAAAGITPLTDNGVFQIWKIKTTTYAEGATVQNNPNNAVNSTYRRWYHKRAEGDTTTPINYSAFVFVNTKVGSSGTPTIFPVAHYPSDN